MVIYGCVGELCWVAASLTDEPSNDGLDDAQNGQKGEPDGLALVNHVHDILSSVGECPYRK